MAGLSEVVILLAVWAIAPVELPLTVAIAKTADVVKECFEKITTSPSREVNGLGSESRATMNL